MLYTASIPHHTIPCTDAALIEREKDTQNLPRFLYTHSYHPRSTHSPRAARALTLSLTPFTDIVILRRECYCRTERACRLVAWYRWIASSEGILDKLQCETL